VKHGASLMLLITLGLPRLAAAAAEPPRIDACALLEPAQIERVIGQAVDAGVRHDVGLESNGAWSSSCVWQLAAQAGAPQKKSASPFGGRGFVILNAQQWPLGSGRAHEFLDSFREAANQGVIATKPSPRRYGDEALWWGDGLAVRRRDASFGLSVHLPQAEPTPAGKWEEGLAPLVLKQLDRHQAASTRHNDL
jgi:hypothetical protein